MAAEIEIAGRRAEARGNAVGILLLLAATFLFTVSDMFAKGLAARLPPPEVAWLRYLVFGTLAVAGLLVTRRARAALRTATPGLQALRGMFACGSALSFLFALHLMPLAAATATYFISPVLITVASVLILGERVSWQRWLGCGIGFFGVMVVVQPGTAAFQWAALLPMASALFWAGAAITTRRVAADPPLATMAWTAWVGAGIMALLMPAVWQTPAWPDVPEILAMGASGTLGHGLIVAAYNRADLSVLAPFTYAQILWAALLGLAAFGTVPEPATLAGGAIICLGGLFVARHERQRARAAATSALGETP